MIERTLALLKPDAVQRSLVGEIIGRFEKTGLKIVGIKMVYPNEKLVGDHYPADEDWLINVGIKQKESYKKKGIEIKQSEKELGLKVREYLMDYLRLSPIIAIVLEGH